MLKVCHAGNLFNSTLCAYMWLGGLRTRDVIGVDKVKVCVRRKE